MFPWGVELLYHTAADIQGVRNQTSGSPLSFLPFVLGGFSFYLLLLNPAGVFCNLLRYILGIVESPRRGRRAGQKLKTVTSFILVAPATTDDEIRFIIRTAGNQWNDVIER